MIRETNVLASKDSIIDKLFDKRPEELAQEKGQAKPINKERFLDVLSNVKDPNLRNRLRIIYLKEDAETGEECARLIEKYYKNGFMDGAKMIIECVNGGNGK